MVLVKGPWESAGERVKSKALVKSERGDTQVQTLCC